MTSDLNLAHGTYNLSPVQASSRQTTFLIAHEKKSRMSRLTALKVKECNEKWNFFSEGKRDGNIALETILAPNSPSGNDKKREEITKKPSTFPAIFLTELK